MENTGVILSPCRKGRLEWRKAPGNTLEIVEIEVDNEVKRTGVGRWMIERLCALCCKDETVMSIYAITRVDNLVAQEFYESLQFRVIAVLRRFYDPKERIADAIMFGRSPKGPV